MTSHSTVTHRGRGRGVAVSGRVRTRRLNQPERAANEPLPQPIPEAALYSPVAAWLSEQGFSCWRDVSFLGRWIDLYAIHPVTKQTVAVELKVADWRRGLRQAVQARSAATFTYLGIWAPFVHRALTADGTSALERSGVGLLSVNGACKVRVDAVESDGRFSEYVLIPSGRPSHYPR